MMPQSDIPNMESVSGNYLPHEFLERFQVLKFLGKGGLGSVFLVQDRNNQIYHPIALKLLNAKRIKSDHFARFKREFDVLTTLEHPNLIEAYELVQFNGSVGYLMEYVEGKNLLEFIRSKRPSADEIELIFSQVLAALYVLHQNGLAHRDIKLENVLVSDDGTVKLSDLGMMKNMEDVGDTQTGILLGTTQYLPPEYVKHNIYDYRSDLYATGLMLFECLSGKRWLEGKRGAKAIRYLCEINFEFPKLALVGLPHKYQRILEKALQVQPWKRFQDANAMRAAILSDTGNPKSKKPIEVAQNLSIQAVREGSLAYLVPKQTQHKLIFAIAGLFAVILIVLLGTFADNRTIEVHPNSISMEISSQPINAIDPLTENKSK